MVGIGPDGEGQFHPTAVRQLEETGRWLKTNGEAIYNTRARQVWKESDIRFTQSKDRQTIYAFIKDLPTNEITFNSIAAKAGTNVSILGYNKPLQWIADPNGLKITLPNDVANALDKNIRYC
jgi:alpha-L-fucosidase